MCGIEKLIRVIGCIEVIEPHLPTLVPYLLNVLNDTKVIIFKPLLLVTFGL
jgi:transportin-1